MLHDQKKECNQEAPVCPDRSEETSQLADFKKLPERELTLLASPDTFQERQQEPKGKGEESS